MFKCMLFQNSNMYSAENFKIYQLISIISRYLHQNGEKIFDIQNVRN